MSNTQYVLIVGNPIDGMSIYGPYDSTEDAESMAETISTDETWWITELQH
jgi:hypothetical protein